MLSIKWRQGHSQQPSSMCLLETHKCLITNVLKNTGENHNNPFLSFKTAN